MQHQWLVKVSAELAHGAACKVAMSRRFMPSMICTDAARKRTCSVFHHLVLSASVPGPVRVSGLDEEGFGALHNTIKRGDLVGVKGYPGKSKRGELSVFPNSFIVLAPCLHMLPKYKLENQVSCICKDTS